MVSSGMPDPVKLKALLARNPPLQKMMESMGADMGMGKCTIRRWCTELLSAMYLRLTATSCEFNLAPSNISAAFACFSLTHFLMLSFSPFDAGAGGMGGAGAGGAGGQNALGGGAGGGRSSAAQQRLAEKLRQKREAADGNIPEVMLFA